MTEHRRSTATSRTILAVAPFYVPYPGGAENSMHEMLRRLVALGYSATAFTPTLPGPILRAPAEGIDRRDGVTVERCAEQEWLSQLEDRLRSADIIFFSVAHVFGMHFGTAVYRALFRYRKKVVYFCRGLAVHDYFPAAIVVANSRAVSERIPRRPQTRTRLLTPLVSMPYHPDASRRRYVTLVNPAQCKGGQLFAQLAEALPSLPFLAQLGWRPPVPGLDRLPNVTIRQPTSDIASVYAETMILLVPSIGEPFGRVALEGALSGSLMLLHRDAGLKEIPAPDFCFIDDLDVNSWRERILLWWNADESEQNRLRKQTVA